MKAKVSTSFHPLAAKELKKLGKSPQAEIKEALGALTPENLTHKFVSYRTELAGFYKFRVGDYRLVCRINQKTLEVFVYAVAHRSQGYAPPRGISVVVKSRAE